MSRVCMRPGCDRPVAARLTYDAVTCQVWFDQVPEWPGPAQEICELHADRLTVPRGWMLCDRRGTTPALFVPERSAEFVPERSADAAPERAAGPPAPKSPTRRPDSTTTLESAEPAELFSDADSEAESDGEAVSDVDRDADSTDQETERDGELEAPVDGGRATRHPVGLKAAHRRDGARRPVHPRVAATAPVERRDPVDASPAPTAEPASEDDELPESSQPTSPLLARAFRATGPERSVLSRALLNEPD